MRSGGMCGNISEKTSRSVLQWKHEILRTLQLRSGGFDKVQPPSSASPGTQSRRGHGPAWPAPGRSEGASENSCTASSR